MHANTLLLLSTFNGEKYLSAQLDSIIAQTYTHWILLIRDDGSSDKTRDLIHSYAKKDPRIQLLNDNLGNLNTIQSFSALMKEGLHRNEPYIFFCDQDDVWLAHKIESTLSELQKLEASMNADLPILIHTDLTVVDDDLNIIHPSFLTYENLKRNAENPIKTLLINNYITGCTIGMNRALLKLATPVPDSVRMHDWWCGLCAAACGKIGFINKPSILYRQHSNNMVGSRGFKAKLKELITIRSSFASRVAKFRATINQATLLLPLVPNNSENHRLIEQFTLLPHQGTLPRYYHLSKLGLQASGFIRSILLWLYLACM